MESCKLEQDQKLQLNYSIATAYSDIIDFSYGKIDCKTKEELQEKALYYYRTAIDIIETISENTNGAYQQLYTNAGNLYSNIGRIIESIKLFSRASSKYGLFPMAVGNKGIAIHRYFFYLYDYRQGDLFNKYAYNYLNEALIHKDYLAHHGNAAQYFRGVKEEIKKHYSEDFLESKIDLGNYNYGQTKREQQYKEWVAAYGLFLNPLNDIECGPIVAHDYIHLPNMIINIDDTEIKDFQYGLFNLIIQEYVSARYLFYDGIKERNKAQISDKDVLQIEVRMNVNSHADFCIRTAFKAIYSLFDRVAYFINDYFDLGIKPEDISFRSIWKTKKYNSNGEIIYEYKNTMDAICKNNFMINAIYWLSKDIFQKGEVTTKPKSEKLNILRNRLEHRYVASTLDEEEKSNKKTLYVSTIKLYEYTLDMLMLAREMIIYLSLGIHIEESRKKVELEKDGHKLVQIQTNVINDDYK